MSKVIIPLADINEHGREIQHWNDLFNLKPANARSGRSLASFWLEGEFSDPFSDTKCGKRAPASQLPGMQEEII